MLEVSRASGVVVEKPVKKCLVNGTERVCMIDLGSDCSLIRESIARSMQLEPEKTDSAMVAFNNTVGLPIAQALISVEVDGIGYKTFIYILPDTQLSKDILLGREILEVPNVAALSDASGIKFFRKSVRENPLEVNLISRELKLIQEGDVKYEGLDSRNVERLMKILNQFRSTVSLSIEELGCADVPGMKIELLDNEPIIRRPYRLSIAEREKVKRMVSELETAGIIRESSSPYASPILLVKKKTGDERMCVDYRALNKVTKRMKYPLPIIDDQIDRLGGKKYFTSLDLKSGFYQIPLHPDAIEKTAFVTPDGHYEFLRVAFGLVNAPEYFQKTMMTTFRGTDCNVYIDDILLASDSIDEGFELLVKALEILQSKRFSINIAKCRFFQERIDYLGREISQAGVRPGLLKVEALMKTESPKDVKQVRQFLGLAGYFRKFIKDFAKRTAPLTQLLHKNCSWKWGKDQEEAVQDIKKALSSRPILSIFDPALETEVHTDASAIGLGAMLIQKSEGKTHVIAYHSRKTTSTEQRYHSYDLETLAVVDALTKFRVYLIGIKFTVVTDCSAVRATATKKDLNPRVARWWVYLQDFDFNVVYRPGSQLAHVDYLSRNPMRCLAVDITSSEWIKVAQLQDDEIKVIREILASGDNKPDVREYFEKYDLKGGVVFRRTETGNKWLVPRAARWNVVKMHHDDSGHFAAEKTLEKIKEHYYFKGMRRFVTKYVKACLNCLYYKASSGKKPGYLHPIEKIAIPFHTLHLDHIGPFKCSRRKNTQILTLVDGFTKFCILEAVRNTKTKYVIRALLTVFAIFGVPTRIITDRGTAFTSSAFETFCKEYGIKHVLNAVATPRANGQCERVNRTVLDALATTSAGSAEDTWDEHVKRVQSAINNTTNRSTRSTPSKLLYGFQPRGMADAVLLSAIQETLDEVDLDEIRAAAKNNVTAEQGRQKKAFDAKRFRPPKYAVGDVVMLKFNALPATGESRKLNAKAKGPFKVRAILPNDRYEVEDLRDLRKTSGRRTVVAVDQLTPWVVFDATS